MLQFVYGAASGLIFFAIVAMLMRLSGHTDQPVLLFIPAFALMLLAGAAATLVHELGHALAARLFGQRVHAIAVLPVAWLPVARRFSLSKPSERTDYAGYVAYSGTFLPLANWKANVISLAGPVAEVSAILIVTWLAVRASADQYVTQATLVAGSMFTVLSISNLIPYRSKSGTTSDGRDILDRSLGMRPNPVEDWAETRLTYMAEEGDKSLDTVGWRSLRERTDLLQQEHPLFVALYSHHAWIQSDIPALSALHAKVEDNWDVNEYVRFNAQMGALLAGNLTATVLDIPDTADANLRRFAQALFAYRIGDETTARRLAEEDFTLRPPEHNHGEWDVLSAVHAGQPITLSDWPALNRSSARH